MRNRREEKGGEGEERRGRRGGGEEWEEPSSVSPRIWGVEHLLWLGDTVTLLSHNIKRIPKLKMTFEHKLIKMF